MIQILDVMWTGVVVAAACLFGVFLGEGISKKNSQPVLHTYNSYYLTSQGDWCNARDLDCFQEWDWLWGAQQPVVQDSPNPARITLVPVINWSNSTIPSYPALIGPPWLDTPR